MNPRVIETNVWDSATPQNNHRRTTIDYGPYASWGLPYLVLEYDGQNVIRMSYTDYDLDPQYLNAHIIGLVSAVHESDTVQWQSKTTYDYDSASINSQATSAVHHDATNYSSTFNARGNVTAVWRWDVTDINNLYKALGSHATYDAAGSVLTTSDPLGHGNTIGYADSFSDLANHNTFAYPTTVTDAGGFSSTAQYNFDFGAVSRTQTPLPNVTTNQPGPSQTFEYDSVGRLRWVRNSVNDAYRFIDYPARGDAILSQVWINEQTVSYWTITAVDGIGRTILTGDDKTGNGDYVGVYSQYDKMGRLSKQSNPATTNNIWSPIGDDQAGWIFTEQTYDWQGRPLRTTNPSTTGNPAEGTYKEASYGGCGCAGGEVVTLTDEMDRQQKIYSDVLGRQRKVEVLTWPTNGTRSVYSTTTNTYNARDQVTLVRQYQGTDQSTVYQDTVMTYDGYGRLKTKHTPEQQVDPNNSASTDHTIWDYNADDTLHSVTDARGASATYSYNARKLVTQVGYYAPAVTAPGSPIPTPPAVNFDYDAAGNRLWMDEGGQRRMTYHYDSLSRMDWEDRQFAGLTGTFRLAYEYNLGGAVKKVTDQTAGTSFSTSYDSGGRVSGVNTVGYGGSTEQFASQFQYRAWGAVKAMAFGNNTSVSIGYNVREQMSNYSVNGAVNSVPNPPVPVSISQSYQYHADGQVKFVRDQTATNSARDRAYKYDDVARLTDAYSGSEARNFVSNTSGGTGDSPYHLSYAFDAWNNTTGTGGRYWSRNDNTTETFNQFNRNPNWTYDAEANVISRPGDATWISPAVNSFDASGRKTSVTQTSDCLVLPQNLPQQNVYTNTQTFDGDGQVVKYAQSRTVNGSLVPDTPTYYLRSTVLGGRTISEYGAGNWIRTYVYAGGERIGSLGFSVNGPKSTYRLADPITGDEVTTDKTSEFGNGFAGQTTRDPNGVDMPLTDPFPPGGEGSNDCEIWDNSGADGSGGGKEANLYPTSDGGAKCIVDGVSMDCSSVSSEAVQRCPNNDCGTHAVTVTARAKDGSIVGSSTFFRFYGQAGWDGSLDGRYWVNSSWAGGFNFNSASGAQSFLGSMAGLSATLGRSSMEFFQRRGGGFFGPPTRGGNPQYYWLQTPRPHPDVEGLLQNPDCEKFLNALLNELSKFGEPYSRDFRTLYAEANRYFQYHSFGPDNSVVGGTPGRILGDPCLVISLDAGKARPGSWFALENVAIHETIHVAATAGTGYTHQQMAIAAYNVAPQAVLQSLKNTNNPGPPELSGPYESQHNSDLFNQILWRACPPRK